MRELLERVLAVVHEAERRAGHRRLGRAARAGRRSRFDDRGLPWNEALAAAMTEVVTEPVVAVVSADLPRLTAERGAGAGRGDAGARDRDRPRAGRRHERGLDAAAGPGPRRTSASRAPRPCTSAPLARGGDAHVVDCPGLAFDVDTPEDLADVARAEARLQGIGRAVRAAGAARPLGRGRGARARDRRRLRPLPALAPHGGHGPACSPGSGALGQRTSRALMGTSVLTPTMRYHPSVVAQAFATLACLTPGRVFLGVGTGEAMNETPATGAEWPGAKERRLRLREAIELMRRLWTEERVTFEGEYYRTEKRDDLRPARRAGADLRRRLGPARREARRARRRRLHLHERQEARAVPGADSPPSRRAREAAGRDPAAIVRMIEIKVSYDHDVDYARDACRWWAALSLTPEQKTGVEDPVEMERLADAAADRAHSRFIVSDDPEEVVERDRRLHRPRLRRTSSSTRQARTSAASSTSSAPTSCRCCASGSRDRQRRLVGETCEHLQLKLAERLARGGAGYEEAHPSLVERERCDGDDVPRGRAHRRRRSRRTARDGARTAPAARRTALRPRPRSWLQARARDGPRRRSGPHGDDLRTGRGLEPQRHFLRLEHLRRQPHDALLDVVSRVSCKCPGERPAARRRRGGSAPGAAQAVLSEVPWPRDRRDLREGVAARR